MRRILAGAVIAAVALGGPSAAALAEPAAEEQRTAGATQPEPTPEASPTDGHEAAPTDAPADDAPADTDDAGGGTAAPADKPADRRAAPDTEARDAGSAQARAAGLSCTPGTVYSIGSDGQIRQVSGGAVTTVGSRPPASSEYNGLGIAAGGEAVYAYDRGANARVATMFSFDPASGAWTRARAAYDTTAAANGAFAGNLVAGGVDQRTGDYYFGGFETSGTQLRFKLWRWVPSTNAITYRGFVNVGQASGTSNGDLAFSGTGELFIVRGNAGQVSVTSVTAASLAAATGSQSAPIPSSGSNSFTGIENINGIAFDADGRVFLGNATTVVSRSMPGFTSPVTETTRLSGSSDLATCSVPPTVTVEKSVGARAKPEDQFALSLTSGGTQIGSATTAGTATGVQPQIVGPLPTARGVELRFAETAAGQTRLADYAASWACRVDGAERPIASGTGTTGAVTIPQTGQSVVCTITNDTTGAELAVDKTWVIDGERVAHADRPRGLDATLDVTPTGAQPAAVAWGQTRAGYAVGQRVGIAERTAIDATLLPGCRLASATLRGPGIDGERRLDGTATLALPGASNRYAITNTVTCEQSLTLVKRVENDHGGTRTAADWNGRLTATPTGRQGAEPLAFDTAQTRAVDRGTYRIGERQLPGYEQRSVECTGATFDARSGDVRIDRGQRATCTITNVDRPGELAWAKTDEGGTALAGSVWTLTGPDGRDVRVEDCVQASEDACDAADRDPAAGALAVADLPWGEYTLREAEAPTGYLRDETPRTVTIGPDALAVDLGAIENARAVPPVLPMTGGTGQDAVLIGGAVLLLGGAAGGAVIARRRRAAS